MLKIQNSSKMAQVEVEVEVGGLDEPQRGGIGLTHVSPLFFCCNNFCVVLVLF